MEMREAPNFSEAVDCIRVLRPKSTAGGQLTCEEVIVQRAYLDAATALRDRLLRLGHSSIGILMEESAESNEWKMVYTQRPVSAGESAAHLFSPIATRASALAGESGAIALPPPVLCASPSDVMHQLQCIEDVPFLGCVSECGSNRSD
jgi:hypothetical protein